MRLNSHVMKNKPTIFYSVEQAREYFSVKANPKTIDLSAFTVFVEVHDIYCQFRVKPMDHLTVTMELAVKMWKNGYRARLYREVRRRIT